jgi:DNA-directed RNA polymerase subunit RPC12/RpoP
VHYGERTWLKAQRKKKNAAPAQQPVLSNSDAPQFQCTNCEKIFFSNRSLNMHMAIHAQVNPFTCDQCDKQFSHKGTLNLHISASHEREQAGHHNCEHCPQRFLKPEHLQSHMLIHNNVDKIEVTKQSSLKKSTQTRTGSKLFECGTCKKLFLNQRKLAIHVAVQTHSGLMPYICRRCRKNFTSLGGLKRHNTVIHKKKSGSVYAERLNSKGNMRVYAKNHGSRNLNLMGHVDRILKAHSGGVLEAKASGNSKSRSRAERKSKTCRNLKSQTGRKVNANSGEDLKELISGILKANTGRNLKAHIGGKKRTNAQNLNGRIRRKLKTNTDRNGNYKAQANRNLKSHFAGDLKTQNGRNLTVKTKGITKSHFAGSMKTLSGGNLNIHNSNNLKTVNNETGRVQTNKAAPASSDDKQFKFKCKKCEKTFPFRGLLKRHAKIHNQEKPSEMIQSSPTKTEVVSVIKNETQIECEHCGKHFSLQSYYDLHCKIMHRNSVKNV